jgi:hypothetical protein
VADENTAEALAEDLELEDPSAVARMVAPVAALAATWVVQRVMSSGYRAVTGKEPPHASDRQQSLTRVFLWAAATAATIAMVNVAIDRFVAPQSHQD